MGRKRVRRAIRKRIVPGRYRGDRAGATPHRIGAGIGRAPTASGSRRRLRPI